jgi:hypothetical protein
MLVQDLKEVDLVKKRSLVMVGVLIFICLFVAVAFANNQVKIVVNGQEIDSDVAPQIIKDRTMVPVRWVAEALGADVRWEPQSKTVYIDKPHYISSNSEADSKLYPFQESNGMYEGFVLEIKGKRQYFDWQNVKNPSFRPQMILKDINHDGGKELIVILTTGTGTGYHTEDIHVLNPASFDFPYGIPVGGFLLISSNTGTGILPYCGGSPNSGTDSLLPCGWNFVPNTEAVAGLVFSGADAVPGLVSPGA